jgi:hypothetical protein
MANKKLHSWQNKTCCKQEVTRLAKQNMLQERSYTLAKQIMLQTRRYTLAKQNIWQTRSYTVGKIKHVVNKKLHGWQNKACCKQEDKRLAKQNML